MSDIALMEPPREDLKEVAASRSCFFFIEVEILESSHDWTRDEFALYLLCCRGYHPASAGSTYGEKGSNRVIGLTRRPWMDGSRSLEERGLTRTIERGMHPVTLLASATRRFDVLFRPRKDDYRQYDGHRWDDLVARGCQLVKIPWRAMDIDRMNPEARIGALRELDSIRLLVWAYSVAHDDGWVSSSLLWLDSAETVVGRLTQDVGDRLHLQAEKVGRAVDELLVCGLLRHSECDNKGRGVLYLTHPMELPDMDREGREEEAAWGDLLQEPRN